MFFHSTDYNRDRRKDMADPQHNTLQYKTILDHIQAGVVVLDTQGTLLAINPMAVELTGVDAEKMLGKSVRSGSWKFLRSDGSELPVEEFPVSRVLREKAAVRDMVIGIPSAKTGKTIWVLASAMPLTTSGDGVIKTVVLTFVDFTERKRQEEVLKAARHEWQQTFDGSRDGICLLAPDQKILRCNHTMSGIFKKPLEEIVGKHCYDVVHGTKEPIAGCPVSRMTKSLRRESMELRIDGRWFEVSVDPILDDTKKLRGIVHSLRDITERITSREELARSEEKYRTLAESSPEMVYLIDRDGFVQYVNSSGSKMFHVPADRIAGRHLKDLYPAPVAAKHLAAIDRIIKTGKSISSEMQEPFPGGMCWIDARLSPVRDGSGEIVGVLGLSQDITERKRLEQELKSSVELYHDLVETAQDLIWQCDAEGRYTYLNPAWESVFGYKVEEMLGRKFTDFQSEKQTQRDMLEFSQLMHAGMTMGYETVHRAKDGRDIHLVFNAKYIKDDNGALVGTRGTAYDISERKKAEQALRQSEVRFRSLFSNMAEGVALHEIIVDKNGVPVNYRIVDFNQQYEKILGVKRENMIGKLATEAYGTAEPPYLLEFCTPGLTGIPAHLETYFQPMDKYFDISIAPWGEMGFATIFTDSTHRKKLEEELLRKQKIEALSVLAGGIAHDFNNLLAGVFGFMDLARETMRPGDPAVGYLGKAFIAFDRAKALSRQLLTFSKGGSPVKKPLMVADLLRECCNLSLSGSNVRCAFSLQDRISVIEADQHQLSQVFSNIMINARQAMPDGGTLTISVENQSLSGSHGIPLPQGTYVRISFKDEGVGIPEKILDKIFDPFFTTKQQGSGLGLAISYSIIKRHGGHIEAASQPGAGSTFTIWLPASDKAVASDSGTLDETSLKGTARILVMDDEPGIRDMATHMLKTYGYSVVTVADGKEAIEKYRSALAAKTPFDLVILDLTVPGGMGGQKAIKELKKVDPHVTACVTSGYADNEILSDPVAHGFVAMIAKPYRTVDLLKTVKDALGKRMRE
jgi:PAS domain S-box-containing protein